MAEDKIFDRFNQVSTLDDVRLRQVLLESVHVYFEQVLFFRYSFRALWQVALIFLPL